MVNNVPVYIDIIEVMYKIIKIITYNIRYLFLPLTRIAFVVASPAALV